MRKFRKLVSLTLLIASAMMMLTACGGKDSADKEADNQSSEPTTTETPTTTEEPTTEEATTEYVFKGRKFTFFESDFNLKNDMIINPGDVIYINEYVSNSSEEYDSIRGYYIVKLLAITETSNQFELLDLLNEKYSEYGDTTKYIPFNDNYSFEYIGDKKVIFKFVEYNEDENPVYDVYKE